MLWKTWLIRVVSNTSPLSNLAVIGRMELLQHRYGTVRIPPVAGVLCELLHARMGGFLPILRTELHRLCSEAGFFIDPGIERFILSQADE